MLRAPALECKARAGPDHLGGVPIQVATVLVAGVVVVDAQDRADHRADGCRAVGEALAGQH
jgi:hypothetical protein